VVFQAVLSSVSGSSPAVVATNLAYPLADLFLLAMVVICAALNGWRVDRASAVVATGFTLFAVSDSLYLYGVAAGTYAEGGILDAGWISACLLFAVAAWQPAPARRAAPPERWRMLVFPAAAGFTGLTLLISDHFHRLPLLAVILAAAAVLTVIARLAVTFAEYLRMIATSLRQAATDSLTGLPNRRRLMPDLEHAIDARQPALLALFDLDGFKHYNDNFGHPAGDALLTRIGARLEQTVGDGGCAYRMGGDEFCVLLTGAGQELLVERCAEALSETGPGFTISASWGAVPVEHQDGSPSDVLRAADQRMYANKQAGRPSPARQSADVLRAVLQVRDEDLGDHGADVAAMAIAVADCLELPGAERENVALAAQLHDVGKIGVPAEILDKPGALDDAEWEFVRRHTVIGERIVRSAPALADVAPLVRASHERFDGGGYPDGLAGESIPLGARIIAVCDSYDAMVTDRVYRPGRTPAEALAELRRCAGSQFDPRVVAAFALALGERAGHALART
jgi:two-component system, cell cycle response regulator